MSAERPFADQVAKRLMEEEMRQKAPKRRERTAKCDDELCVTCYIRTPKGQT